MPLQRPEFNLGDIKITGRPLPRPSFTLPKLGKITADALSPFVLTSTVKNTSFVEDALEVEIEAKVTEKNTGVGVPLLPMSFRVNDEVVTSGQTDQNGVFSGVVSITPHRAKIRVQVDQPSIPIKLPNETFDIPTPPSLPIALPSREYTAFWDNFNDNSLDKKVWETLVMAGPLPGGSSLKETNKRIQIYCGNGYQGHGMYTKDPIDITDGSVQVDLHSQSYEICALTVLPESKNFYPLPYNEGYNMYVWNQGIEKFSVNALKKYVYNSKTMAADPDPVRIVFEGDQVLFYENGKLVYQEKNRLSSNVVRIYMWALGWYVYEASTATLDNLLFFGG